MSEPTQQSASRQIWERGWDGHEQQQRERLAKLSLPEKLAWLEESHRLVLQLKSAASRKQNGAA